MAIQRGDKQIPDERAPGPIIMLGPIKLTGAAAIGALITILALIGLLVAYLAPTFSWSPLWISAGLWLAFLIYWGRAAKNSAPTASSESLKSRRFHQNLLSLALVFLFLRIPGINPRLLPGGLYFIVAGLAIHSGSFALAIWARRHLGRYWSGAVTIKVDHQIVDSGPYRLIRHPIYTAYLGMTVGTAMVSGRPLALIAVLITVAAYWRKIRLEEETLRQAFGASYDAYRRKSWALIPGLF
ncbi:MAG TPA: isoprenylcysteine carboxylmethyltransferase family protein [Blastocatellia bacterium]